MTKKLAGKPRPRPRTDSSEELTPTMSVENSTVSVTTALATPLPAGPPPFVPFTEIKSPVQIGTVSKDLSIVKKAMEKNPNILIPVDPPPEAPKPDEFKNLEQVVSREERIFDHFDAWFEDWKTWLREHSPLRSPASNPCGTRRASGLTLSAQEQELVTELDSALGSLDTAFENVEEALEAFRGVISDREEKLEQLQKGFSARTGVPNMDEYRRLAGVKED